MSKCSPYIWKTSTEMCCYCIISCERTQAGVDCRKLSHVGPELNSRMTWPPSASLGRLVTPLSSLFCCQIISAITGGSRLGVPSHTYYKKKKEKEIVERAVNIFPSVQSCSHMPLWEGGPQAPSLGEGGWLLSWELVWALM